jgi:hypothetical protein
MEFRTKIDYSSNRQITQREKTSTLFSGSTTFGLPFSGLTSGVDFDSLIVIDDLILGGVFTGTTGTTIFTWSDSRASLGDITLSPITPLNSGETQSTGQVFVVLDSTVIDGYTVNLSYTGVSLTEISVNEMIELTPGIYSGSVDVFSFEILSASTLDFKGRTIWIDNPEITRTRKLIVSDGATNGYVLTSNSEGMGYWAPVSGSSVTGDVITIDPFIDLGSVTGFTWDVSGNSTNYEVTLTGNTTMDLINVRNGESGVIIVNQDGVGNRLLTFGTVNGIGTTHKVLNGGGGSPTLTGNANAIDILSFIYNGTNDIMYWTVGNDYT